MQLEDHNKITNKLKVNTTVGCISLFRQTLTYLGVLKI